MERPIIRPPAEHIYLTGGSEYPPPDPGVGGLFALFSRLQTSRTPLVGHAVRPLPEDCTIHGFPDWRWIATPGHTAGHISLWRQADGVLVSGDACLTLDSDSVRSLLARRNGVWRPITASTTHWPDARASVNALARLKPAVIAAGHGAPLKNRTAAYLETLAEQKMTPDAGYYRNHPAY